MFRHVQYTRTDSGRQTLKVDPSTGSQVVTLLTEVNSATGSQVKDDGSYFSGGDGSRRPDQFVTTRLYESQSDFQQSQLVRKNRPKYQRERRTPKKN